MFNVRSSSKKFRFVVSDEDRQNLPQTFTELRQRCNEIKNEIHAHDNNIDFAEKIFMFFKDCGLITRANIDFLNDNYKCRKNFYYPMNPVGGVLRREGLSMGNPSKYYKKRAVICEGVTFFVSNYWFDNYTNTNKAEFYNWVVNKALVRLGFPQNLQVRELLYIPY